MVTYIVTHLLGGFLGVVCARLYLKNNGDWTYWPIVWTCVIALVFGPFYLLTSSTDLKEQIKQSKGKWNPNRKQVVKVRSSAWYLPTNDQEWWGF